MSRFDKLMDHAWHAALLGHHAIASRLAFMARNNCSHDEAPPRRIWWGHYV